MRPPSGATFGYSSCPYLGWAGPVPRVIRAQDRGLVPTWQVKGYFTPRVRAQAPVPSQRRDMMRFYNYAHRFYCGIDLHARSMYLCILDEAGTIVLHKNLATSPETFLKALAPFRDGLVVAAECMFACYWVADLCQAGAIPFVLGHALYMKAIHGGKTKNDKIDSFKIA